MATPRARRRDAHNPLPLYHRVRSVLKEKIYTREYPPGSRLPSERDLARLYRVSRITLRQALAELERERIIRREQGQGTFVTSTAARRPAPAAALSGPLDSLIRPSQITRIEFIDSQEVPAPAEVAEALGGAPGDPVRRIRRVFWGEREPFADITNYVPVQLASRIPAGALERTPLLTILQREFGVEVRAAVGTVDAALADATLARRLRVEVGSAVLVIRRTVLGADMAPLSFNVVYAPGNRYRISIDLRDAPPAVRSGTPARARKARPARR